MTDHPSSPVAPITPEEVARRTEVMANATAERAARESMVICGEGREGSRKWVESLKSTRTRALLPATARPSTKSCVT